MIRHHRTVDRIAAILETVSRSKNGMQLADLARALDSPKSSINGLLHGLVAVGYLTEVPNGYIIGPGLEGIVRSPDLSVLTKLARSHLESLSAQTGETVVLGTAVGTSVTYVDQVPSDEPIRYVPTLFERRPMVNTSMGKVFLAESASRNGRTVEVEASAGDPDTLRAELEEVRRTGIGQNRGESVVGVYGVAHGIRDRNGKLVAAISVTGPEARVLPRLEEFAALVRQTAQEIGSRYGARR
ncbi:IclR family transcriptional regulator [Rhodococcus sp. NPDC059968]|uniref:IclR family transcriptional regulator n=1 Tax=Rhodococcus sp. NPDC059968 TaxID=3347017 RepID=UPI00366B300B